MESRRPVIYKSILKPFPFGWIVLRVTIHRVTIDNPLAPVESELQGPQTSRNLREPVLLYSFRPVNPRNPRALIGLDYK